MKKRPVPVQEASSQVPRFLPIVAGCFWTWAVTLLATRVHLVGTYGVVQTAPPLWGMVLLPAALLVLTLALGLLITLLILWYAGACPQRLPRGLAWLLASAFVPALDLVRLLGFPVPATFIEPLVVTAITTFAVGEMAASLSFSSETRRRIAMIPWLVIVWVAAFVHGLWWYWQSASAYDNFMLGFNDFGHFGQRVANTWAGRGFLMETPSLPPFWDHFNPGLALLAPLWGLWPDPRLFMLVQAACLALSAPIVFGIARQVGATSLESAMWAAAYLVYPPLSQLNLSYSYGWHPVSLALPLLLLTLLWLLKGRPVAALAAALLACSFREDVVVILGCLAAAMALQLAWARWRDRSGKAGEWGTHVLAGRLPLWAWTAINVVLVVSFAIIYEYSGFRQFQVSRFDRLGDSGVAILASPVLRPAAFWGTVLRPESAYYLSALLIPLGVKSLFRGRWILLTCALPMVVLLAWGHKPATTIAFQYTTTFIPILLMAAMIEGAERGSGNRTQQATGSMWSGTLAALAGCAVASLWLGASPWSQDTQLDVIGMTYATTGMDQFEDRGPGSEGLETLHEAVALVKRERAASVLATGRIASHFVGIARLDTVGQAPLRWKAFEKEAGPGRSAIELFDWVVIDTYERFQQSEEDIRFILEEAERAGYRRVMVKRGIIVLARPD